MNAAEGGVTPRSLSALGGALFASGAGGGRVFVYDVEAYRTDFDADAAAACEANAAVAARLGADPTAWRRSGKWRRE